MYIPVCKCAHYSPFIYQHCHILLLCMHTHCSSLKVSGIAGLLEAAVAATAANRRTSGGTALPARANTPKTPPVYATTAATAKRESEGDKLQASAVAAVTQLMTAIGAHTPDELTTRFVTVFKVATNSTATTVSARHAARATACTAAIAATEEL
jgi:hypothetical protein